jgi:hypothetical protein
MKEMWYVSTGLVALAFVVDVFPMLSVCTLLWVAIICISRAVDNARNGDVRQEKNCNVGDPEHNRNITERWR